MVKYLDLNKQYQEIKNEIDSAMANVITRSAFIGGEYVATFEREFAAYQEAVYCIGVGNGTDALEIAIESLELPKGSEIIVPANSFIASAEAVTRSHCKVIFCDCDKNNYTISIPSLRSKITKKTRAIIAVHLYGHPCDMNEILAIANEHDLRVIEDCAQSHGATYKKKKVGAIGDIGTFSFYPGKNLGAYGDGGAIVTNDEQLAKKCKMIANHGRVEKYKHEFVGRNSRLDGLQASILSVKLKHLDNWTTQRIEIANYYRETLLDIEDIVLPKKNDWAKHVYHIFAIRVEQRNALKSHLEEHGIQTGIHYPISLPELKAYEYLNQVDEKFFSKEIGDKLLSLPIGEHIQKKDITYIVKEIRNFYE